MPPFKSRSGDNTAAPTLPVDKTAFSPSHTFYILPHNLWSVKIEILNLTGQTTLAYDGGDISDEFRNAARKLSEDKKLADAPVYSLTRPHWWSSRFTVYAASDTDLPSAAAAAGGAAPQEAAPAADSGPAASVEGGPGRQVATWKHPHVPAKKAVLDFAPSSPSCSHRLTLAPAFWARRTNLWVQDSVQYAWECDAKFKSNRMTLTKTLGRKKVVCAMYAQKWPAMLSSGVLLVDQGEIDVLVAALTACVMLKKMQQRRRLRNKF